MGYICPRCKNTDERYFYHGSKGVYCRKCVSFRRVLLDEEVTNALRELPCVDSEYQLGFSLTREQLLVTKQVLKLLQAKKSVLISAICGAGKTELVYAPIAYYLKRGKRVGFAISRRQVVLQVAQRLQRDFSKLKVIPVCEGYTQIVDGDLIVCTTHQLYRYVQAFDLLILDEPDAFPYCGNTVLQGIASNSCKGEMIYLSATPDVSLLEQVQSGKLTEVKLCIRPSRRPLQEPICFYLPQGIGYLKMILWLFERKQLNRQCFVFLPTIQKVHVWQSLLSPFFTVRSITSKTEDKDKVLQLFGDKKLQVLFCTTILERGITFEGIDVLVMECDHRVFTASSLIQIMGRVARGVKDPSGEGVFIARKRCETIEACIEYIRLNNETAFGVKKI